MRRSKEGDEQKTAPIASLPRHGITVIGPWHAYGKSLANTMSPLKYAWCRSGSVKAENILHDPIVHIVAACSRREEKSTVNSRSIKAFVQRFIKGVKNVGK